MKPCTLLAGLAGCGILAAGEARFTTVEIVSSRDGSAQKALWWTPGGEAPVPLVVALHTWSGDYRQPESAEYLQRAAKRGWAVIHPDFRGSNTRPAACGSDEAVADVVDAVHFARKASRIDERRVYLAGASGGGYLSLLVAARYPEIWAGVTSWVPIADLAAWHGEASARKLRYAGDLETVFGGPPSASQAIRAEYLRRSPLGQLHRAAGLPIDINAGIHDGHAGSVPIGHSLLAFNELAEANRRPGEKVEAALIGEMARTEKAGPAAPDPAYPKPVLFRREAGPARVTLFEGGHEILYDAAFTWLEKQRKER